MRLILSFLALAGVLSLGLAASPAPSFTEETVTQTIPVGTIYGTLMLPATSGPVPVALIVAGSGPTDRNGNDPGLTGDMYRKLAQALAARGIATLRYDKRFIGESVVKQTETQLRLDDYVDDAALLADRLAADPRFSSVTIVGHSEGSLIGILAAERDTHIAKVVTLEGAGRNLADIVEEQVTDAHAPPGIIAEIVSYDKDLRKGIIVPSPDPAVEGLYRPSVQPYLISEFRYDPAVEIAKLTQPVLIVQGTHDIQVQVKDARLLAAGNPKAVLAIVQGMNHVLVDAPADRAGNIATYSQPLLPVNATMVASIADFIRLH